MQFISSVSRGQTPSIVVELQVSHFVLVQITEYGMVRGAKSHPSMPAVLCPAMISDPRKKSQSPPPKERSTVSCVQWLNLSLDNMTLNLCAKGQRDPHFQTS